MGLVALFHFDFINQKLKSTHLFTIDNYAVIHIYMVM